MIKTKENIIVACIIALFLAIKIPFFVKYNMIWWDGAVFIGIGKYIASLGSVGLWEPARPLGLSLIFGPIWRLGFDAVIFAQIIEILFAAGNIFLVYLIGKKLFSRNIGLIASVLLAFTPLFFFTSTKVYSGIPSTFFALLAFYFFIKKRSILAGLFVGISFMFRFPQALLFIALIIAILLNKEKLKAKVKSLLQFSVPFFLILLSFFIFNIFMYKDLNIILAALHPFLIGITQPSHTVYTVANNFSYYFVELFKQNPLFLFAIPALFFRKRNNKALLIVLALFLLFFILFMSKLERFSLIFLPYICLLASFGIYQVFLFLRKQKYAKIAYALLIAYVAVSCIVVVAQDIEFYSFGEPPVVREFYTSEALLNAEGYILTTDPVPAAFTDKKFVPYYENPWEAERIYDEYGENAAAVIYTPHFFPCEKFGEDCEDVKASLFERIKKEKTQVLYKKYDSQEFYLFT
ncbi:MAG: glycosyltransferase family 39 protein [bacterium]|nr:glycosyltransferase family 39 protein [bacterium]